MSRRLENEFKLSQHDKDHPYHHLHTLSKHELIIKQMLLNERHVTIMEAWDEKSIHKTNLKLKTMYNKLWEELELVQMCIMHGGNK